MLKMSYFEDTDTLYIDFSDTVSIRVEEVREDILIDYDNDGKITGICFEHAQNRFNLQKIKHMYEMSSEKSCN